MDLSKLPSYDNDSRGYIGFHPYSDYMCNIGNWSSTLEYDSWSDFISEFEHADDGMNVVVNFFFCKHYEDDDDSPVELNMWLLHPRKSASRGVYVKYIEEDDLPKIKEYMSRQFKTIKNWFAWVRDNDD